MQELDDIALLREYTVRHSQEAFAALVSRHINKVYSVALRHTGNALEAEEITQTVFVLLARKASQLGKNVIIEGWLYQTARLAALTQVRGEIRRHHREQEALMQSESNESAWQVWNEIAPFLDEAMDSLNETDRHAVVLRFFYGKSMKEIGAALEATEGAATTRLHRALDKLRQFFVKHGVTSTAEAIGEAISAHSIQAAPPALAKSIAVAAMAKTAAAGATALPLAKGGWLSWLKAGTLAMMLTNAFVSQEVVATHFNLAGNPDYWMSSSQSSLVWLVVSCGFPLFFIAVGYSVRFPAISRHTLNVPHKAYWLAPERIRETSEYVFRRYACLAFFSAIFILTQMLLQIQANHQHPPHLSTPLALAAGAGFIAAAAVLIAPMLRHFNRVPDGVP